MKILLEKTIFDSDQYSCIILISFSSDVLRTDVGETVKNNTLTYAPVITETILYCSASKRRLSILTVTSSRCSSISLNPIFEQRHSPPIILSIEPSSSVIISSINKIRLSSLEHNSALSEFDQEKLDVIIVPKKMFSG